jgi:hypothetical protein
MLKNFIVGQDLHDLLDILCNISNVSSMVSQVGFNFLNKPVEVISTVFDVFDQPVVVYGPVSVNQTVSKIEKWFQSLISAK